MTSAKIISFLLRPEESLHSLQTRIEGETGISTGNQELLLETGICLDPRKPASQCVIDGVVRMILCNVFHILRVYKILEKIRCLNLFPPGSVCYVSVVTHKVT